MILIDRTVLPLLIPLDVDKEIAQDLLVGERVGLRSPAGKEYLIGAIDATEFYNLNKRKTIKKDFRNTDTDYLGVENHLEQEMYSVEVPMSLFNSNRYNQYYRKT